jgi:hypothetical protein
MGAPYRPLQIALSVLALVVLIGSGSAGFFPNDQFFFLVHSGPK